MANSIIDWENLKVLHRNRMPDRHILFPIPIRNRHGRPGQSISGCSTEYGNSVTATPSESPEDFYRRLRCQDGMTYRCL